MDVQNFHEEECRVRRLRPRRGFGRRAGKPPRAAIDLVRGGASGSILLVAEPSDHLPLVLDNAAVVLSAHLLDLPRALLRLPAILEKSSADEENRIDWIACRFFRTLWRRTAL